MTTQNTPEPFGYFRANPFGWEDCASDADGATPLFDESAIDQMQSQVEALAKQRNELLEALEEGRRAIGDHYAPSDCYATGPMTGDPIRDLVECPACSFIAMYERVIASVKGA